MEEMKLKPFDKVLVRNGNKGAWTPDIFKFYDDYELDRPFICIGGNYSQCIAYKNNEELIGTTNKPKEILPEGTPLMISDEGKLWYLAWATGNGGISTYVANPDGWKYKIKVIDFDFKNPENSLKYNIAKNK